MLLYACTAFANSLEIQKGRGSDRERERERKDQGKIIGRGKRSRPEIAEGVFGPALTTGMHEETASIPQAGRWFRDTGGLSGPHAGPAGRPALPTLGYSEPLCHYSGSHWATTELQPNREKYGTNCSFGWEWKRWDVGGLVLYLVLPRFVFLRTDL